MLTFSHYDLLDEVHGPVKLLQSSLNFKRDALEPVLSKNNIDLHYGKLYKGYVDRYNKGEGDPFFNQAGAFLHNIYFSQLQAPHDEMPTGDALTFIEKHFKSWSQFKEQFEKEAMMFKGSGWIYLDKFGQIKTIKDHMIVKNIVLLIDWWEHAFILDYGSDKKSYLKNHWKIINWSVISSKIALKR